MAQITPSTARTAAHVQLLNRLDYEATGTGPPRGHYEPSVLVDTNAPMNRETRRRVARTRRKATQRRRTGA